MRKVISTMMMALVAVVAFAQAPNQTKGVEYPGLKSELDILLNKEVQPHLTKKSDVVIDDWYRFFDGWRAISGGFSTANTFFSIFPDTTVKNLYLNEEDNSTTTSWQAWNSIGQMFDPVEDSYGDVDLTDLRDWRSYTVDSIRFNYGYFRSTNSAIVDTLIIQIYNAPQVTNGTFTLDNGAKSAFGIVGYDYKEGIGANYTQLIKIPLTEVDSMVLGSEGFTSKVMRIGLESPLVVPPGGACAVTITYRPGVEYATGDTLFVASALEDFGVKQHKKINRFGLLAAVQTPVYTALNSQNNGLFIVKWNRYKDYFKGNSAFMNKKYYPNFFSSETSYSGYYPYISFKVQANYDAGIEDVALTNGFGLGKVYPNPANQYSQMNLTFAINNSEKVNIAVFDLTGKKVQTITNAVYEKGEHTVSFVATDLQPGMYIYTMTAGEFSTSKKFNIIK